MCGIAGVFHVDGKPVSTEALKRMTDIVRHRGPDGEGFWSDSSVGLGHRRLAILDLTAAGEQPMRNDDGSFVITYNGEVYNHLDLMKELGTKGHRFRSRTDTEVVLRAFQQWGLESLNRLNGMFAFAIWDKKAKELTLARDRYGVKPLYYYYKGGTLLFGSEIKSILQHPEAKARVSIDALNEYFSFQNTFSYLTLFEDIRILPPGHFLRIKLGEKGVPKPEEYWDFSFEEDRSLGEDEAAEELTRLFERAVERNLQGDVEIGAYLSGGMDSGSIVAVASQTRKNLKTFTCGFDLSSASGLELNFDERARAETLSHLYKSEQYEVVLKAGDMERIMPDLIWHLEDHRVGQCYPNYYISRLAAKFVKVVLSGTGGDEIFAGYPWRYYFALNSEASGNYTQKYYDFWQRLVPDQVKPSFFSQGKGLPAQSSFKAFSGVFKSLDLAACTPEEYVNRSLYFEAKTFLHGLLVVEDKLSMANGLESRVPFLDNELVDFAQTVRVSFKLKNLREQGPRLNENEVRPKHNLYFSETRDGKLLLRRALSKYLPEEYTHGLKQGFSAPDASWFKGESIDYIRKLLGDRKARIYDFLDFGSVSSLIQEHFDGKTNRRLLIWSLLSFEWWNRKFIS
jgi:asparagine synthase (glutamine-hydrolysing)